MQKLHKEVVNNSIIKRKTKKYILRIFGYYAAFCAIAAPSINNIVINNQINFVDKAVFELRQTNHQIVSSLNNFYVVPDVEQNKTILTNGIYFYDIIRSYKELEQLLLKVKSPRTVLTQADQINKDQILKKYDEHFFNNNHLLYISYSNIDEYYFLTSFVHLLDEQNVLIPYVNMKAVLEDRYFPSSYQLNVNNDLKKTEIKFYTVNKDINLNHIHLYNINNVSKLYQYVHDYNILKPKK